MARIGGRKVSWCGGEGRAAAEVLERRERLEEPWRNGVVSLRDWRRDIAGFWGRMWAGSGFSSLSILVDWVLGVFGYGDSIPL